MSGFAPLKVGGWAFGEILTSAQMNQLNTDFPFALNGRDGGSYAPSSAIVIGGSGLSVTAFASLSANVELGTNASNTLTVHSVSTFLHLVTASGGLDVFDGIFTDTLSSSGDIATSGNLSVSGVSHLSGVTCAALTSSAGVLCTALTASSAATVAAISCSGTALFDGLTTHNGGHIGPRVLRVVTGPDSTYSVGPATGATHSADVVLSGITSANTYTIDDTGAIDGMNIEFNAAGNLFTLAVHAPDGTPLGTVSHASGGNEWLVAVRLGGIWSKLRQQKSP